ncbi:MAG: MGMT family protein [Spirochaetaceae bacterium]|nr:MGMT family protein [Spirochaetaceae bacterium]
MRQAQTERLIAVIKSIPAGCVCSYGMLAALADYGQGPQSARQVARILSSLSEKEDLPWWRVVRRNGSIALPEGGGFELQKELLHSEGVEVDARGVVDFARVLWPPQSA